MNYLLTGRNRGKYIPFSCCLTSDECRERCRDIPSACDPADTSCLMSSGPVLDVWPSHRPFYIHLRFVASPCTVSFILVSRFLCQSVWCTWLCCPCTYSPPCIFLALLYPQVRCLGRRIPFPGISTLLLLSVILFSPRSTNGPKGRFLGPFPGIC